MDGMEIDNRRQRARGRWKLLRQALINKSRNEISTSGDSIHSFASGLGALPQPSIVTSVSDPALFDSLSRVTIGHSNISLAEQLEPAILSILALSQADCTLQVMVNYGIKADLNLDDLSRTLSKSCSLAECSCKWADSSCSCFSITFVGCNDAANYNVYRYDVGKRKILARERTSRKVSLEELVSHQHHKVDNTGNICVWDSEKTLTWVMHQEGIAADVLVELGAGMAGLAALSFVGHVPLIYITDGHSDSIKNNRVNSLLTQAVLDLGEVRSKIICEHFLWSLQEHLGTAKKSRKGDWTIVSDCTHFEEFHGDLLWSCLVSTKVGGHICLCQPDRGGSLSRFLELAADVGSKESLLCIEERTYPQLQERHQHFLLTDPNYDPNIHFPRIFVFKKTREVTNDDRDRIQELVSRRKR